MTTALSLNAQSIINNGGGLSTSANLLSQVSTYQAHPLLATMANTYSTATASNANVILLNSLSSIGSGVTKGQWLIDAYPSNITPICSGAVNSKSFSTTLYNQFTLPFANGMAGFANVFLNVYSSMVSNFETVASVYMLQGKTYGQAGLGYTKPLELSTNGIDSSGALLGNVVSQWGTMYDIANMNSLGDPYIFGQNLLNQGLGSYGGLSDQLAAAGLDITNLSQIPQGTTTTTQEASSFSTSTSIGAIELPTVINVTNTTSVTGTSESVVLNIYASITGANLNAIANATQITASNVSITTLADYLNFNKVIDTTSYTQLNAMGANTFSSFGTLLQAKVGKGYFKTWTDMSRLFGNIDVPSQAYTSATTSSSPVVSATTISTLNAITGTGSGAFNNPIVMDYLGSVAGMPYTSDFTILNTNYNTVLTSQVTTAVNNLNQAVQQYDAILVANIYPPDITTVDSNVALLNTALNSIPVTPVFTSSQTAYLTMLNRLTIEVNNLNSIGIVFNSGSTSMLRTLAKQVASLGTDKVQYQTYQFFANIITDDANGDAIRSAISEYLNLTLLTKSGITTSNDPNPNNAILQASAQNIPISTYLSQNK